ncbi:hypothetical protein GF312_03345 [Candidatus Poribacteria bacterium]|nr:hypothetical protein [Candidatus Poribacteria bacterium]
MICKNGFIHILYILLLLSIFFTFDASGLIMEIQGTNVEGEGTNNEFSIPGAKILLEGDTRSEDRQTLGTLQVMKQITESELLSIISGDTNYIENSLDSEFIESDLEDEIPGGLSQYAQVVILEQERQWLIVDFSEAYFVVKTNSLRVYIPKWINIYAGSHVDGKHNLNGSEGTVIRIGSGFEDPDNDEETDEVRTDNSGEYNVSFTLPFNLFDPDNPQPFISAVRIKGRDEGEAEGAIALGVQLPIFDDVDIDLENSRVRNGDTIEIDVDLEDFNNDEIELVTLLPDFSNIDSTFHGSDSIPDPEEYSDQWTSNPNDMGLDELINDVIAAINSGKMYIEDRGNGRYSVSYTISELNVTPGGFKTVNVRTLAYPSSMSLYDIEDVFESLDLIPSLYPQGDILYAKWTAGQLGTDPIELDSLPPNFDFGIINPFVKPPSARAVNDELAYLYKPGDIVRLMVQIDPHDLSSDELEEINLEDINNNGVEGLQVQDINVYFDISELLEPSYLLSYPQDSNGNEIPDVAEIYADYAGNDGIDNDFDESGNGYEDDEDITPNGFNERFIYTTAFVIDSNFKGVSNLTTTEPLPVRILIEDGANNKRHYSFWKEIYDPDTQSWATVNMANWVSAYGRDPDSLEQKNPVVVDEDDGGYLPFGGSAAFEPNPNLFPVWDNGHNIVENWDKPWRIIIDADPPNIAIFDSLKLNGYILNTADKEQVIKGAAVVPPASGYVAADYNETTVTNGTEVYSSAGNYIYEIGGDQQDLTILSVWFPGDNDIAYVKFMYSATGQPGTYIPMKGYFNGDVQVTGLYDIAGNITDTGYPGVNGNIPYHDGFNNGDDDNDGDNDLSDDEVHDANIGSNNDGVDNDADGLVDADDKDILGFNTDIYDYTRDEDEDGIMDEDEYIVRARWDAVKNAYKASWAFDPVRIARILDLDPNKAYAIKAVPFDHAGNMNENSASYIYVIFRVSGKGITSPEGSVVTELYKNGELLKGQALQENQTYELKAQTEGTVEAIAFQYSMDKNIWVNMPTAFGEPNPDSSAPYGISWRPMLTTLSDNLWVDNNGNGVKDFDEPTYQMGDLLYIRSLVSIFNPYLGRYTVNDGLNIDPQYFIVYTPLIPTPSDPDPPPGSEIQTLLTDQPALFIPLYQGWNLISIPLKIPNIDSSIFVQDIEDNYRSIWTYDSFFEQWRKRIKGQMDDLYIIQSKKAYWIDMAEDDILLITGEEFTNTSITLYNGWNMAGYCSLDNQSTFVALSTIYFDEYVASYTFDNINKTWLRHMPNPVIPNTLLQYIPGNGYYIYVGDRCTWTVTP